MIKNNGSIATNGSRLGEVAEHKTSIVAQNLKLNKMSNEAQNGNFAKPMLPAVYWLVIWLGCCLILGSIFYSNIQNKKRVDKIFEDYYKEMSVINGR